MDIRSAKFETSATNCKKMMGSGKPEIAFVGRSNVGKSTIINMLTKQKKW